VALLRTHDQCISIYINVDIKQEWLLIGPCRLVEQAQDQSAEIYMLHEAVPTLPRNLVAKEQKALEIAVLAKTFFCFLRRDRIRKFSLLPFILVALQRISS